MYLARADRSPGYETPVEVWGRGRVQAVHQLAHLVPTVQAAGVWRLTCCMNQCQGRHCLRSSSWPEMLPNCSSRAAGW